MKRDFSKISKQVIGCAIEVHRVLGPGLLEAAYQQCLAHQLELSLAQRGHSKLYFINLHALHVLHVRIKSLIATIRADFTTTKIAPIAATYAEQYSYRINCGICACHHA